ncbi:uroporphyrinogen-III C-methyltransferase [Portibacter marinus]|uniref:uroporphyrinogen-III C-methyltransferase n=1 Tax=Portibacter marinus TaxID=2898660 RepID=UPI001F2826DF|nr:uroporphyrinogen-III C-methyltransferase [Portibacter marinus]
MNKISLVGAGPGDPDLITLRGLKTIQSADVLLYDALVHPALIAEAPSHALKIFVGKRAAKHFATQEEINDKLIDFVRIGHVVRLKGGDPFVFGRGFEELIHAEKLGIPVEIIPGLSSATAVSAWNGLPVTLRNISRSFHVVTAVGKNGNLSKDFLEATDLQGTVVVLMGLGKLDEIVQKYLEINRANLGIAVIQNGTLCHQKAVYGTINEIREKVSKAGIATPAIIYIGEVVNAYLEHSKTVENATEKSVVSGIFQA